MQNKIISKALLFIITFFSLCCIYFYFNFNYYMQLDDYIQYHNYMDFYTIKENINRLGVFASYRPLASFLDLTLFTFLFKFPPYNLIFIVFLHTTATFILKKVLNKYFELSNLFIVIFLFLPVGIEGNYWISASSRIVVSLFFISLSIYFYQKFLIYDNNYYTTKKVNLFFIGLLFFIFNLMSICIYEQMLILSIILILTITFFEFFIMIRHKKRLLISSISFFNIFLLILFKLLHKISGTNGVYTQRGEFLLPSLNSFYLEKVNNVFTNFFSILFNGNFEIIKHGFINFFKQDFNFLAIFIFLLFSVFLFYYKEDEQRDFPILLKLFFSFIIFITPILIFLIIKSNYISMRNINSSILGFAMFLDILITYLLKNLNKLKKFFVSIIFIIFAFANVSEIYLYKENNHYDNYITDKLVNYVDGLNSNNNILILNLKDNYLTKENYHKNEHILGVTSSNWAMQGILEFKMHTKNAPKVYLTKDNMILNYDDIEFSRKLYFDDESFEFTFID